RILNVSISKGHFVRRKGSAASRAVKLYLESLIEKALFEVTIQGPPDRLDVFVLARDVRVFHVDPVAHTPREVFPHVLVFENRLPAFGVEFGDAVLFDLAFVFESELLLDFDFDWKAVRVPTCFAMNLESTHRLIAAN